MCGGAEEEEAKRRGRRQTRRRRKRNLLLKIDYFDHINSRYYCSAFIMEEVWTIERDS